MCSSDLVAVHVTVVVPVAKVEPEAGEQETEGVGVPVAVGFVHVATWLLHWVMFAGHAPITGVSLIVTVNEQEDEPQEFVAVHVTVVVPVAKVEPEAGEQETEAVGVPVAVGVEKVTTWLSHCVMFAGHAPITGVSLIVTVNEQALLPQELVAVQVTVVVPVAKVEPEAGEQETEGVGVPVAVGFVHVEIGRAHV